MCQRIRKNLAKKMTCDIIDYRQNEEKQIHATKQKTPEVALQGLFCRFWLTEMKQHFIIKGAKTLLIRYTVKGDI